MLKNLSHSTNTLIFYLYVYYYLVIVCIYGIEFVDCYILLFLLSINLTICNLAVHSYGQPHSFIILF